MAPRSRIASGANKRKASQLIKNNPLQKVKPKASLAMMNNANKMGYKNKYLDKLNSMKDAAVRRFTGAADPKAPKVDIQQGLRNLKRSLPQTYDPNTFRKTLPKSSKRKAPRYVPTAKLIDI